MRKQKSIFENIDWLIVGIYLALVLIGWVNIYAAVYNEDHKSILDISQNYGRQMIWIGTSLVLAIFILVIDGKFFEAFAYPIYGFVLLILVAVLLFGREVAGSKSWFEIGAFRLQPAEFAKFATNMALAKYLSTVNINMKDFRTKLVAGTFIIIPIQHLITCLDGCINIRGWKSEWL